MGDVNWPSIIAQGLVAVLATITALTVGDLLSARARHRRRVDKMLGIADKLPDGTAKSQLIDLVEREALLLVHRETTRVPWYAKLGMLVVLVMVVLAVFNLVIALLRGPTGDAPLDRRPYWALIVCILLVAIEWAIIRWSASSDRKRFLAENLAPRTDHDASRRPRRDGGAKTT